MFELDIDMLKEQGIQLFDTAKKTAQDIADKGKNQLELLNQQARLSKAQRQLGALVYSLHKAGEENQPLVDKYIDAVAEVEKSIEELKANMTPEECAACEAEEEEQIIAPAIQAAFAEKILAFGPFPADGFFAAVAAIGFGAISDPPMRAFPVIALLAAVGHALRFVLMQGGVDIATASLCASVVIGVGSLLLGGRIRCPMTVLFIPALLPMIPGMYAYKTVLALMQFMAGDAAAEQGALIVEVFRNGLTTMFVMFALAVGASLPLFIFHRQSFMMTRLLSPGDRTRRR